MPFLSETGILHTALGRGDYMPHDNKHTHCHHHAFTTLNARRREGLTLLGRRSMLKAGLAGMAGLTLPELLRTRTEAAQAGRRMSINFERY